MYGQSSAGRQVCGLEKQNTAEAVLLITASSKPGPKQAGQVCKDEKGPNSRGASDTHSMRRNGGVARAVAVNKVKTFR